MKYLEAIARHLYRQLGSGISDYNLVFPNRRAGRFFREYLRGALDDGDVLFEPDICTCNDLFNRYAPHPLEDRTGLLLRLYRCHQKLFPEESFDTFLYFGEIILGDFNDIDHYLVDARRLYANQQDLDNLTSNDFLTNEQRDALNRFWKFSETAEKPKQARFFQTWSRMYQLYVSFREDLTRNGLCYEGMQHRMVAEADTLPVTAAGIVFIGFNAIDGTQRALFRKLRDMGKADFYWDYDSSYLQDPAGRAHTYVERNLADFPTRRPLPDDLLAALKETSELPVDAYSVPSADGQARLVHKLLSAEEMDIENHTDDMDYAAVVLADEQLLLPVLGSLPESIQRMNVTMGYPLKNTPARAFLSACVTLQKNRNDDGFFYQDVTALLQNPMVAVLTPDADRLSHRLAAEKRIRVSSEFFAECPALLPLFTTCAPADAPAWMQSLLRLLEDSPEEALSDMDREFIYRIHSGLSRLSDLLCAYQVNIGFDTLARLVRDLLGKATVPFEGEPIGGLQVMGMLETRCLDFDQVIITSFNEGVFPKAEMAVSFIPYHLRQSFGLPTTENQDAIFAYHFYRLIQRAKHVSLLYDSRTDSEQMKTGEESRFLKQLRYLYDGRQVRVTPYALTYNTSDPGKPIRIEKDANVLANVRKTLEEKPLSASALNTCGMCNLRFYLKYVAQVNEPDEIEEDLQSNQFGSILHKVMKDLYDPLKGNTIAQDDIKRILDDKPRIQSLIHDAYIEEVFGGRQQEISGVNAIYTDILAECVTRFLNNDAKNTPFRCLECEKELSGIGIEMDLPGMQAPLKLTFMGILDRLDEKDGVLRIIDYKSGGKALSCADNSLFTKYECDHPSQMAFYRWLLHGSEFAARAFGAEARLYHLSELRKPDPDTLSTVTTGPKGDKRILSDEEVYEAVEIRIKELVTGLLDPDVPFEPAKDDDPCKFCPYTAFCEKHPRDNY